jgi:hypothetical protein
MLDVFIGHPNVEFTIAHVDLKKTYNCVGNQNLW